MHIVRSQKTQAKVNSNWLMCEFMMEKKASFKQASYFAIGIVAVFLLARSGGLATIQPFMKYLLPIGVCYWVYRKLKKKLLPIANIAQEIQRQQAEMRGNGEPRTEGPTIEICPKCGNEISPSGKCAC